IKFKIYMTLLLQGKESRAHSMMEEFQFTGDTPALYYARQHGSTSIIIRKKPLTGPVLPIRFIRQRSTVFSLTRFTMSGGCKGPKVRPHRHSRSIQQMLVHRRERVLRLWNRVQSPTEFLLQISKANRRREKALPWPRQHRDKIRGWNLPVLSRHLDSRLFLSRTSPLRKQAIRH